MKTKFKITVYTNEKSCVRTIIISVILVIIGCILIAITPEKPPLKILGIISSILGGISLMIVCFQNIRLSFMESKIQKEMLKEMHRLDKKNTFEEEKSYDLGNTKIKYKKQITINNENNIKETFYEQDLNDLGEVRRIIICPNCGSKKVTKTNNSQCQYCDAYIE